MTLLFSFPDYDDVAGSLLKTGPLTQGKFSLDRFLNQELHVSLQTPVKGKKCLLLGSISPPESNIFSFLIVSHTLKKEGAKKCIAVAPYLAYTRHEHNEVQKSQITALLGPLFQASGIDEVITCDLHSELAQQLVSIPVVSLSTAKIFVEELRRIGFYPDTIVSPDEGALKRCRDLSSILSCEHTIVSMKKIRDRSGIIHPELTGPAGKKIVIIDDILDTGETLVSAVKKLQESKPEEIVIMVTHGVFTGDKWKQLFDLGVKKLYCTNSIPHDKSWLKSHRISELSIAPILEEVLCRN